MLGPEESGHCCRVLRMHEGDEIFVVDGKGMAYHCRILNANPKGVEVEILSVKEEFPGWGGRLTLAVAPTKNADRMEWLVEKAVEMGVDEIVLLVADRSERRKMRTDRLEKIMVAAMKQSLKAKLPKLKGPVPIDDFLKETASLEAVKTLGYCLSECDRTDFGKVYNGEGDAVIMIGPEGDFSPREVGAAMEAGYKPVTFGDERLRTETAAMYGVAAFHVLNNLKKK